GGRSTSIQAGRYRITILHCCYAVNIRTGRWKNWNRPRSWPRATRLFWRAWVTNTSATNNGNKRRRRTARPSRSGPGTTRCTCDLGMRYSVRACGKMRTANTSGRERSTRSGLEFAENGRTNGAAQRARRHGRGTTGFVENTALVIEYVPV